MEYIDIFDKIFLPNCKKNIYNYGIIKDVKTDKDNVYLFIDLAGIEAKEEDAKLLEHKIVTGFSVLKNLKCICCINADFQNTEKTAKYPDISGMFRRIEGVHKTVAVISGKGGVGKTHCSLKLANQFKNQGFSVGVCDLDIYGASIPLVLNISSQHEFENGKIKPIIVDDIQYASVGMLAKSDESIIWRGAMLTKIMEQLLRQVDWNVDVLVIDTPPGTGDIHINLLQKYPIDNIIAVTTNDEVSVVNTKKCINLFQKHIRPIDRVYVNMSNIFGKNGYAKEKLDVDCEFIDIEFER